MIIVIDNKNSLNFILISSWQHFSRQVADFYFKNNAILFGTFWRISLYVNYRSCLLFNSLFIFIIYSVVEVRPRVRISYNLGKGSYASFNLPSKGTHLFRIPYPSMYSTARFKIPYPSVYSTARLRIPYRISESSTLYSKLNNGREL